MITSTAKLATSKRKLSRSRLRERTTPAKEEDQSWRPIVSLVAGAVGGAAWVSTVGSGIVGIRLSKANLPSESVVALMSPEHRFVIGAGYLIVPLLAGGLVFLADILLVNANREDSLRAVAALVLVTLGYMIALFVLDGRRGEVTGQWAATVVILTLIIWMDQHPCNLLHEQVIVFLTTLVVVGAISLWAETTRSPVFEQVAITLKDKSSITDRYYVTTTENSVVTASLEHCQAIDVVPRDSIARIVVGPARVRVTPSDECRDERTPIDK